MKKVNMNWKRFNNGDFPKDSTFCWVICENELTPRLAYYNHLQAASFEGFLIKDWTKEIGEPVYWAAYKFSLPSDKSNICLNIGVDEVLKKENFVKCF